MERRNTIIDTMTHYLENACAYLTTGETQLYHYSAGKADALREHLEEFYGWDERHASEHVKAMWDIIDENW